MQASALARAGAGVQQRPRALAPPHPCGLRGGLAQRPHVRVTRRPRAAGAEAGAEAAAVQPSPATLSTDSTDSSGADDPDCPVFIDREGNMIEVMCCDYGFRSGVQRVYSDAGARIPAPALTLALTNFAQEWRALRRSFRDDEYGRVAEKNPPRGPFGRLAYGLGGVVVRVFGAIDERLEASGVFSRLLPEGIPKEVFDPRTGGLSDGCRELRAKLSQLTLDNDKVWAREHAREARGEGVETPWFVKFVYLALCVFLDVAFDRRPIARFWFLETVARMPYFSYLTMLHLFETLGWWRAGAELRRIHFAEEWNELHHLQIMEALGGDRLWIDRFMAQHAAFVYYWVLVLLFVVSPQLAYNFSELIEAHAVDTYGEFADANEALLKTLPPPLVAAEYYRGADVYMFESFQTSGANAREPRRPQIRNLHDVFIAIRDDEGEHVSTMQACQDYSVAGDIAAIKERLAEEALDEAWGSGEDAAGGAARGGADAGKRPGSGSTGPMLGR